MLFMPEPDESYGRGLMSHRQGSCSDQSASKNDGVEEKDLEAVPQYR